jgi:hypothetical protein
LRVKIKADAVSL